MIKQDIISLNYLKLNLLQYINFIKLLEEETLQF